MAVSNVYNVCLWLFSPSLGLQHPRSVPTSAVGYKHSYARSFIRARHPLVSTGYFPLISPMVPRIRTPCVCVPSQLNAFVRS